MRLKNSGANFGTMIVQILVTLFLVLGSIVIVLGD